MDSRLAFWVQIVTGAALILGLALVWIELQQAKMLSLAELTSAGFTERLDSNRSLLGEEPAEALERACFSPDNLSQKDAIVLNALFENRLIQISRLRILEAIADYGVPWEAVATEVLREILITEHGRWWYRERVLVDAKLTELAQPMLDQPGDCAKWFERFRTLAKVHEPFPLPAAQLDRLDD